MKDEDSTSTESLDGKSSAPQARLELVPLYKPRAVFEAWPVITDGIRAVLENSQNEDEARLLNHILAGDQLLWICFVGGRYAGFTTTSFEMIPTDPPKKVLWINYAYRVPKAFDGDEPLLVAAMKKLTVFAIDNECDEIRFKSLREDMDARATALGFERSFVEYRKEL